jgi:hypothetical protein
VRFRLIRTWTRRIRHISGPFVTKATTHFVARPASGDSRPEPPEAANRHAWDDRPTRRRSCGSSMQKLPSPAVVGLEHRRSARFPRRSRVASHSPSGCGPLRIVALVRECPVLSERFSLSPRPIGRRQRRRQTVHRHPRGRLFGTHSSSRRIARSRPQPDRRRECCAGCQPVRGAGPRRLPSERALRAQDFAVFAAFAAARARSANVVRSRIEIVASRTSSQTAPSELLTSGGAGSGLRRVA